MRNRKIVKILITVFIILLPLGLFAFLFIYPSVSDISLTLKNFDLYRSAKNTYIKILSEIAPTIDKFDAEVLAASSIEDSIGSDFVLDEKILEEEHAYVQIESVDIKGNISEGTTSDTMLQGFWHIPTTVYPGEKGNVVIIGHRFQYVPPAKNTFFNLNKVQIGDKIVIGEDDGDYTYIVTGINIVEPNDISILEQTNDYRLTLVTCTPLWTSEKRLVITAKLDKLYKKV